MLGPIEPVTYRAGTAVYRTNEPISHLIFVDRGLFTMARRIENGQRPVIVSAAGGPSSILGLHTLMHPAPSLYDQNALTLLRGWTIHRDAIHAAISRDPVFGEEMQRLAHIVHAAIADRAACRGVHTVEQRYCRQLMIFYRAMGPVIPVRRSAMARIVAISRSRSFDISANLGGIVTFHTNGLVIDDPAALEQRACGCFHTLAEWKAGIED
jgi:CRP-like cAMP-binding protein